MSGESVRTLEFLLRSRCELTFLICQITEIRDAEDCYFTPEETKACVDEAHAHNKRVCSHARARESVKQSIDHGVDVIYHASYIDEEGQPLVPFISAWQDV